MEGDASSAVDYDVFLSFRGPDTRRGFVDQLYYHLRDAGIRIFTDTEVFLVDGDKFDILHAISVSRICVPIFSRTYASSRWCLDELAAMVKLGDKVILPIFYDVRPEDVRLKTSLYTRDLQEFRKRYGPKKVNVWEDALKQVASIKGVVWEVRYQEDGKFWRSITAEILRLLIKGKHTDPVTPLISEAEYEVYLSSAGGNTDKGLSDKLYQKMEGARIRIFRYYKEFPDDKWKNFVRASNIFIPVFSMAYASSTQCLEELEVAAEQRRNESGNKILPVFYDVECRDVQLETGNYLKALIEHTAEFKTEKVRNWMKALEKVGPIKPRHQLDDKSHETFCDKIVEEVANKLRQKHVDGNVPCHSVGIRDAAEAVIRHLNIDSGGVKVLVIHGKGGTGKTTLAKLLFDLLSDKFECRIFLANIRELSERYGLEYLQNQACKSIARIDDIGNDEAKTIRERCRSKRVLMVLDDVDKSEQMKKLAGKTHWFGAGSRIIVTTRDEGVVPDDPQVVKLHNMMEMDDGGALQLLCRRAFEQDTPPNDYLDVSKQLISTLQRLPLEIEIVGSFLQDQKKTVWQDMVTNFHNVPHNEVLDKLIRKIIYGAALTEAQREIFLDIACLFANMEETNPVYMWEACDLSPNRELEFLESISLIKSVNNKLWMHDMLRDLGRKIVLEEKDLGKRSRLWIHEEAQDMLKRNKGTDNVKALSLRNGDSWEKRTFGREAFAGLQRLRFLEITGVNLDGDFENLLPELRWLSWHDCPSEFKAKKLCLENLAILDLSRSCIDDMWAGWDEIQMLGKLKVLDLTDCKNLTTTPDLSRHPFLERLILEGCESLSKIHRSIGTLTHLVYFNVKGCVALTELPEVFDSQTPLEHLSLSGCSKISALPDSLGKFKSLIELDISAMGITELPPTENLVELRTIKMESSSLKKLPSSIGRLKKLEQLYARNSKALEEIPREVGDLRSLKILDFSHTAICELPDTISELSLLQSLNLDSCHKLLELPKLPNSLIHLRIKSQSLRCVPDLSELTDLKDLVLCVAPDNSSPSSPCLSEVSNRTYTTTLPKLVNLELCLSNVATLPFALDTLSHLRSLHLSCPDLRDCPKLPYSLVRLTLADVTEQSKLPDLTNLAQLSSLRFENCAVKDDWFRQFRLGQLKFLENLSLCKGNFTKLMGRPDLPVSLKSLFVADCNALTMLSELEELTNLEHLELSDCKSLIGITGLEGVKRLRELIVRNCNSLERFGDLSKLGKLRVLQLEYCNKLHDVQHLDKLESLRHMRIYA